MLGGAILMKDIKAQIAELSKRANQRRIALSATKCNTDAKVEHKAFEDLQEGIYKNIARS